MPSSTMLSTEDSDTSTPHRFTVMVSLNSGWAVPSRPSSAQTRSSPPRLDGCSRPDAPRDESQYYKGEPFYKDTPPVGPVWDFSYDGVMTSFEESLGRLGLDRVDILLLHDPDHHYDRGGHHRLRGS